MLTRVSTILCRQTLLKANMVSQEMATYRYIHLINQIRTPRSTSCQNLHRNCRVVGIPFVRYASTNETLSQPDEPPSQPQVSSQINPYDEIPDPPTPAQEIIENIINVHPNGEATLSSIGLGGYSPVGFVQKLLEFVHISCDIPWWGTIVIGTLCIRIIIFPLVIKMQKNMVKFNNHLPEIQKLQVKMTEARQSGDHFDSARAATELMQYMKKNQISAMQNFFMPLIQAPIFISFFLALRGMANAPVESLKHGGFWWMQDLTLHDPYYIMPIVTSLTFFITIEMGAEGTNLQAMGIMRYALRALPIIIFPFMIHFPGAVLTYWASTNFISLAQTSILKIPRVRKALDMPTVKHCTPLTLSNKKGFTKELKEAWTNMKITKQLSDRERVDAAQFNSAGKGPIVKTFKYDPTKQKQSNILTKNR